MPDDLIERARYCHEHGIFDASHAGMMVSYGELADAIERLTARAEAAEARVKVLEEALIDHNCGSPLCICVGCIEKRDQALGGEHDK